MRIAIWIAHPYLRNPTFIRRGERGVVFSVLGFTVNIMQGAWKFDWQGRDGKRKKMKGSLV